jgi:carbonic anhydrase/acetyltransferase-like protein (isoleucine patch superfamily)
MAIRAFEGIKPHIHSTAWVDETAVVIGNVTIGADSSVWPMCVIRGDIHEITIGERTNIQDGSVLHVTHAGEGSAYPQGAPLIIGNGVIVGHGAMLHGCVLEDECLVGIGAKIMDNAIIRRHALVAAGAVVGPGKDIEGGYIWMGNPARKGRTLSNKELEYFEHSASYYVNLKNRHQRPISR